MKLKTFLVKHGALLVIFFILQIGTALAVDIQILGGFYDQAQYPGYQMPGMYKVELSKDNYSFTSDQFEINISLPSQGAYDPARASEAVIPAGWELVLNSNTSMVLRLLPGATYSGSGSAANRRKDFYIPIITSGPTVDNPSLVTLEWKDFLVDELPGANSNGSSLNVANVNLPVTLVNFVAAKEGSTALLSWATTEEVNSDRFEIERSQNGKLWDKIGVVASHHESNSLKNYSFNDETPLSGQNLYRLRMVDRDNTFAYSSIKSLEFTKDLSVYPNPSSDFIRLRDVQNVSSVSISDLNGRQVYRSGAVEKGEINVKNLTSGMYTIRIEMKGGGSSVQKLVVAR